MHFVNFKDHNIHHIEEIMIRLQGPHLPEKPVHYSTLSRMYDNI